MIVKVYSTQMGEREIETSATTWGELQNDLSSSSITYNGMKSVIGESKLTLEADAAILPTTGFTLFLMPKKTKAGVDVNKMSYREIRSEIKSIIEDNSESGKAHFNVGKNYTTKGTEELRGLLASWLGQTVTFVPVEKKAKKVKAKAPKKNVPDKKKSKKEKKEAKSDNSVKDDIISKAQKAVDAIEEEKTVVDVVESVKEVKEQEVLCQKHAAEQEKEIDTQGSERTDFEGKPDSLTLTNILTALEKPDHSMFRGDQVGSLDSLAKNVIGTAKEYFAKMNLYFSENTEADRIAEEEARLAQIRKEEEAKVREKIRKEEEEKAEKNKLVAEEKANKEAELKSQMNDMRKMFGDVK